MNKFPAIALTIIAILFPEPSAAHTFTGRVERLIDGDTIIVRVDCASRTSTNATNRARPLACSSLQRVRLAEIDAPEMKQPYGPEAKKALSDMILHRSVVVQWKRRGRYRCIIG